PLASISSRLARPPHTLRTLTCPRICTQCDEPAKGSGRKEISVRQLPHAKSNPCACTSLAGESVPFGPSARTIDSRVRTTFQFGCHLPPPSSENACCQR